MEKINTDYILIILNCKKYKNKSIIQKNGWLKSIPDNITYYHIIGDKEKCKNEDIYIDENDKIIYCNTLDDYNNLPAKVITTLRGINKYFNYKYIFKTDDDQKLNKENFFIDFPKLLENKIPKYHYGGHIVNIQNDTLCNYWHIHNCLPKNNILKATTYASGRFYFLSKKAVENLITKKEIIEKHYIEDHAIGYHLDSIYKKNTLNINTCKIFFDNS